MRWSVPAPAATPLFRLHQVSRLPLVVAVPEAVVGGIVKGAPVPFTVPAYPGETFYGVINLAAHDLDPKTRTMPVELDVKNTDLRLAAGMYSEVSSPVRRPQASLLVPPTSVVTTTERTFVIRVKDGAAEWVNVGRRTPARGCESRRGSRARRDRLPLGVLERPIVPE